MNCKPGDLAVIVNSEDTPKAVGSIVRCIKYEPGHNGRPAWIIDKNFGDRISDDGRRLIIGNWFADFCLRPIRDQDGEDEMIRIAGKPNKEKVDG